MSTVTEPMTMKASVEIAQKLRVAIVPGTVTEPPEVAIAGAGEAGIGVNDYLVAITKDAAIVPYNKAGTMEMVAAVAIAQGEEVYPAAAGKITNIPSGNALGFCMSEATADGDIIEVFVYPQDVKVTGVNGATIATTGDTDEYIIAPKSGNLAGIDFSGIDALAANDTNYITFSVTNLGQAGAGSVAMLAATDANTTKATGGSALVANSKRQLTLHGTALNLAVVEGDRLLIKAAASGTLANTVTGPVYSVKIV